MVVVFCLDDGDRDVRLVEQDVVRLLCFASLDRLASNDDAALCEITLLQYLRHHVPLRSVRPEDGRRDELRANVGFGKVLLVHARELFRGLHEKRGK